MTYLINKTPKIIIRLLKYTFFSSGAFWFDILLIVVLVELISMNYLIAAAAAFIVAHSLNYALNRKWNFQETKEKVNKSYLNFISFGLLMMFLILLTFGFIVETFELNYILARLIVGIVAGSANFSFNYFVSFRMGSHFSKDIRITK